MAAGTDGGVGKEYVGDTEGVEALQRLGRTGDGVSIDVEDTVDVNEEALDQSGRSLIHSEKITTPCGSWRPRVHSRPDTGRRLRTSASSVVVMEVYAEAIARVEDGRVATHVVREIRETTKLEKVDGN